MDNQQILNAHLATVDVTRGPVTQAKFKLDLRGFKFFQGSGSVPPGVYQLTCEESAFVPKSENKPGANWMTVWRVSGPVEYAGVKIVENHPVPFGPPRSAGLSFASSIAASVLSGMGMLEQAVMQDKLTDFTIQGFVGKVAYAELQSDFWKGREYSKVRTYVSKQDFEKSPGPFAVPSVTTEDENLPDGAFAPGGTTTLQQTTTVQNPPEIAGPQMTQQTVMPPVVQQPQTQPGGNSGAVASDVADITSFFE